MCRVAHALSTAHRAERRSAIGRSAHFKPQGRPADEPSMQVVAFIGVGAFCAVSAWVGLRLLLLFARTGRGPERDGAVALLGIGPLGFGLTVLSGQLPPSSLVLACAIWALAAACLAAGTTAAYAFTYRVFHPESAAARFTLFAAATVLAVCWIGEGLVAHFRADLPGSGFTRLADFVRTGALLWGAVASLRQWFPARRRVQIGLSDRGVADRFLLWGVGLAAVGAAGLVDSIAKLVGLSASGQPALLLMNASTGALAALALYLAFVPAQPLAWLRPAEATAR